MIKKQKINSKLFVVIISVFIIITSILGYAYAKYILSNKNDAKINFYEYRIAKSEIVISPEEYTGKEVTVTITTEKTGLSIQYKLGDSEEWIDYTGPFSVDENTNIEARLVAENFEGPITDKEVTNIAVCKIGDTYYKTVESAIAACTENAGTSQTKIEMLTNVTESVTITEGKNIILDLCGKTITSDKESTIIVEGKFNLIDSAKDGKVEATNGSAIVVKSAGNFTIGTNEREPVVENKPIITGENYGVVVEEGGELNFYDGEISGKTNAINGNATKVPDGYAVVTSNKGEHEVATLEREYTVSFDANGGTASFTNKNVTINSAYGNLPTVNKREGYEFLGWETADNQISTNEEDWEEGAVNIKGELESSHLRLRLKNYLRVSPNTKYTISTNNSESINIRLIVFYDENYKFIAKEETTEFILGVNNAQFTTPSNCAYMKATLIHSNGSSEGAEISLNDLKNANIYLSAIITDTTKVVIAKNHTLKAKWVANEYTINYHSNGGSGTMDSIKCTYDKDLMISKNTYTSPKGYTFKEWNTKADGTGTSYKEEEIVKNLSATQSDIIILYAIWEDKTGPSNVAPTGTSTTSTITVNCNQKDDGSGIDETTIEYAIFKDEKWSDWQTSNIFEGLNADTEYQIKTRATDKDGNGPTESEIGKIKTKNIQIGTITIHKDTPDGEVVIPKTDKEDKSKQINNNIYIDITQADGGTTTVKVKKLPDGETKTYTEDTNIETETGVYEITIETTDGTNTQAEIVYVFVDKTPPSIEPTETHTTNKITIDSNAKDDDSGIKEIKYVVKNGEEEIATIIKTPSDIDKTAEIPDLPDNTEYTIEIIVTDNAGNEKAKTIIVKTEELLPGSIEFTETTSNEKITPTISKEENKVWTNESVQTKLTPGNAGTTTYTVQKEGEESSKKYTNDTEIATTDGNYIVTIETTDGVNTKTITYYFSVDKILPTVTIDPNGAKYTIAVNNNTANIGATLTSVDNENGSGVSINKYAWTTSNEEEPKSWSDFVSETPVTNTANGGVYYLWTKVIDNAGNEAVSIKTSKEFDVGYAVEYDLNGGNGTIENQRKVHNQDLTVTSIKPEKEGYVFKGWATSNNAVSPEYSSSSIYSKNESIRLYAVWSEVVASTTIDGVTTNYDSVQNAVDAAGTNTAVVTLLKDEIDESVTIAAGQSITLNTNGKTLKSNETTITNYGTLAIEGEGVISNTSSELGTILNNATLNITNGTILSENYNAIMNEADGVLTISGGIIEAETSAIYNCGTSTDELNPSVKIEGGTIDSNRHYCVENISTGTIVVNDGRINTGVRNREKATVIVNGGTIESNLGAHAIRNYIGNIEINGGVIKSSNNDGVWTSGIGNVLVTGGTITGATNGVVTTSDNGAGTITITGGTIEATGESGYSSTANAVASSGIVIIGNNEDIKIADIEQPILIGSKRGILLDGGTLNFYDGIIKVPTDATLIDGKVTDTPTGYRVVNGTETIDGVEYKTAYLDRANVEIQFDKTEYTYTGEQIIPEIRVLDEDIVLVEGQDYDVTYTNNVEAGTATVNVVLKGDYLGTETSTFTINKVVLTPIATSNVKTYDGTTKAEGTVYLTGSVNNEHPTVADTYKFEFEDSTSGINKKVNVTNIQLASSWEKNYTLSTNTLTLTDGTINQAKLLAKYEGEEITFGQTPDLKVIVTGFVNNEDENTADGYIAPSITNENTEVGVYTLIPTGGEATNYTFEHEGGSLVIKENMAEVIVTLNPEEYVYDGTEKEPEVIVTDKNTGEALTYETDYTFFYSDNINAGTASVTVNLKGNYSGSVVQTFIIKRADGEGTLSIEGWTYGGNANNPIVESSTNGMENVTYTYTGTKNNGEQYSSNIAPTEAGDYTVTATIEKTTNYNQVVLEEDFVIAKCTVAIPTANTNLKYTGSAQTGVEPGSNYSITGNVETNAGNYEAIATLSDGDNYEWEDKSIESKNISWQIEKIKLTPIAIIEDKIYDGTTDASGYITLEGAVNSEDPTATAVFTYERADCGEQTIHVTNITLDDIWKTNYELVTDNLETTATINKKDLIVTKEDYTGVYDGKSHEINVTVAPSENVEIYYSTTELTSSNYNVDGSTDKIAMVNSGTTTVYYYVHDLTGNYEDYASFAHSNNGTITISKVTLAVSATCDAKQYDGSTDATGTITLEGAVNGEEPTATGRFTFETKDAVTRKTVNVEEITLDGNWNTNYTLDNTELVLTNGVITAKEVIPIITAENKTYDGTINAVGAINLEGIIDGDNVTPVVFSYTFDTKDCGEEKTVTASEITLSGEDSSNYALSSNEAYATATITKAKLTPSVTVDNKVYDGTVDATGTIALEGAVNGEKPTAIATFMFENKDVGNEKQVTVTNIILDSIWSTNYELTKESDTKTANITKATLKAKYNGETILFGGTPRLEIDVIGFANGENETTAEDYVAPTISNSNTQVGNYDLIPEGGSSRNYDFTYEGGTLVIEPNNSNVTVSLDNYEYTYTGEEHKPQVTVQIEENILVEGQDYDVVYDNNIEAGTATVKITLKGNYSGTATESFTINKAEGEAQVTIEGWAYGENAKSPVVTSTTNDVGNVTYTYYIDEQCTLKTTSEQGATEIGGKPVNSGIYYVIATLEESNNYKEVQATTSFEIKKAILTPTAILNSKTYDGTTEGTGRITFTGAVNNELPTATAIFTYTDATSGTDKTVDVTEIELDSNWNINYELSKNSITLTNGVINKAILTAKYNSESIYYGESPKLEVTITGFVNDETEEVIETMPIIQNTNTKVGTYTLTPEGGNATNYSFSMVSGILTINKKSIQNMDASLDKSIFTYNGLEKEPGVTVLDGETELVKDIDYTVSYTNNVNAGTANVTVTGIGNYEGTITKEFTIEKANMNVEVTNYNGIYDGKSHTITLKTTPSNNIDIYYNTNIALTNTNYIMIGNPSNPSRKSAGTDTVYYYIHDKSGNYNDYSSNENNKNGKIQINAKTMSSEDITAVLDSTTVIYDGKAKEPVPTVKDGDTTLTVGTDYTVKYEDNINVGTGKVIITGTGSYSGEIELTFTIDKKVLTVNVIPKNKVYDGTNTASCEISLEGVVDGDDVTVTSSSSKFANSTVGTGKTVTITGITLHGEDSVNYKLQSTTATTTADITKKELIATYVSETIDYGETPALRVTVTGFVGSETAQTAAGYTAPKVTNTNTASGEYVLTPNGGSATNYSFKYVSATLTINASNNVTITLSPTSYTYDGTAKKPTVTVKDKNSGNVVSTDNYTVTYTNNINAGTATAKVTLKGNYSGTVSKTFTINKASRAITATTPLYVGKGVNKDVSFTYTGSSDVTATVTSNDTATATATMTDGNKGGTVKVTGVAAGTGGVTITVPEDTNYNKVTKAINVIVTDFTIVPATGTIAKGGTITITPTITPTSIVNTDAATTISWKSGSTSIATVNKASTTKGASIIVTGVASGTATITATLNGQSKTSKITVSSVASTTIGDKTTYYTTVQKAIDAAGTNVATVKLLYTGSRTEAITVAQGQNITLNTNGATLKATTVASTIENNGTLTINGTGKVISTEKRALTNNGTAILGETVEFSSSALGNSTVVNNGNLTVSGAKIISENYKAIYNGDTKKDDTIKLTITDGTITANKIAIENYGTANTEDSPAVKITGNPTITANEGNAISNKNGLVYINGGTIDMPNTSASTPTVINNRDGKILITSGTIKCSGKNAVVYNGYNSGNATGTVEIRGGTIESDTTIGVKNNEKGQIIISGGTITSTKEAGIDNISTGTITIGTNESTPSVSITTPSITGTTAGIRNPKGTFNFYDGIIMGPTGESITGTVTKTPDGYVVVKGSKTVDGTTYETSVLGSSAPVVVAKLNNASGATYTSGTWTNKNIYTTLSCVNVGAGIKEYQWYENGAWTTRALTTSNNVGTITYTAGRNETIRFRAIDNNGVISAESTFCFKIDKTLPTITVSPTSATTCKTKSVTITVKDEGGSLLSSGNSYQYYLSSSSTALSNGEWKNYTSGTAFSIGSGITGTRYLFVKRISDNAGNVATANGTATTISNVTYQRFGSYVFDNTKPTAIINTESMYITDGLVTRLDGVNNNGGSHSSSVTTWKDLSSNSKNGTITAGTWGANYLEFNGTSSWVNLGAINNDYQTIEATFSPDVVSTSQQCIIGNWENGGGGILINSKGQIYAQYYIGGAYRGLTSKVKVAVNQKYHIAVTYNGTTMILYVNGVEQERMSVSGTIKVPENSTIMALGTNPGGTTATNSYFDGKIYNVAVYNKALTEAQVKTNADAGKALAGGPTNASSITYTIRFNEAVTGFTTDDVTITNGTKGAFTEVTAGRVYRVAVTTSANQNNTQTIALAANGCADTAGNGIATTNKTVVIDRALPTVKLSTNGGTYNIIPGNTTISVNTTPTASDTGSGIAGLSYGWSTSNSTQPSTWTEFISGTAITKELSGGNNYLWTNVTDNAGNRATSIKTSNVFTVRYQVVFNANSGSGAPSTQYKVHGTNLTLSSTKPTRTGYTFKEWNTKADGTGTSYTSSYTANSAVTLYAQWTVNNYTITYDYNYMDNDIYGTKPVTANFQSVTAVGTTSRVDNPSAKYGKEIRYTITTAGSGGAHLNPGRLTVGNKYTWSVYLKASKNITMNLGQEQNGKKQVNLTTSWQRFTYTFTAGDTQYNSFTFYATGGDSWAVGDVMYMHSLELKETPTLNIKTQNKTFGTTLGTLETPSRAGYTFNGWYTAPVGGTKISDTTKVPASNTTYYAQWTVNTYKVTVNANGGTIPATTGWTVASGSATATKNVIYGVTYGTLPTPTRTGYTFAGWNGNNATTDEPYYVTSTTKVTTAKNHTLNAIWTANELTFGAQSKTSYYNTAAKTVSITGASNGTGTYTYGISSQKNSGGTAVTYFTISGTTITVAANTPVGKYTVVVKATDSGSKKTKEATITITVQYPTLTLNGNGGTATQAAVYTKYGTTSKYTAATGLAAGTIGATRTGYTLNGWYTAASGGTKVLNADGTGTGTAVSGYTNASKQFVMTSNQTLYAQWTINKLTVRIHMNGGALASSHGSAIGTSGNYVTLNDSTTIHTINYGGKLTTDGLANMNNSAYINVTRTGYHVVSGSEYNTKADGTGKTFDQTSAYAASDFADLSAGNKTIDLYVKWVINTYTVEYYQGNNSATAGATKLTSSSHTYGTAKALTAYSGKVPSGWTFAGWSANNGTTATTVTYTNSQSVNNLTATNGGTIKLYAIFKRNVTFKSAASGGTSKTVEQRYNPHVTTQVTAVTPPALAAVTNWTATGYRADATASTATATTTGTVKPAYNLETPTYYGVYSRQITFKSGAPTGTASSTKPTQYLNVNGNRVSAVSAPAPTAITNWTALGYRANTTADKASYTVTTSAANISPAYTTGNTLYAVYSRALTIKYAGNSNTGGSTANTTKTIYLNSNQTATSSQAVTLATNGFTRTGYTFSKWTIGSTDYAGGASYTAGLAYNANSFTVTATAKWTVKKIEVTFMRNTTSSDTTNDKQTFTYGVSGQSFSAKGWTKTGYTLAGWSTNKDATDRMYTVTSGVNDSWINSNSPKITLYAVWTANELTFGAQSKTSYYNTAAKTVSITGASNGTGTYTYGISSQENSGGTAVTYFTISGTTITIKASTPVGKYTVVVKTTDSGSKKTKEATITITVQYPTLTLNGNGGTATQTAVYTKYGTTSKYTAATGLAAGTIGATRTGYTLNGWYTAASGGTKVLNADGTGTGTAVSGYTNASKQWVMTANKTLYAQWTQNNYDEVNASGTHVKYYATLAGAMKNVQTGNTIKVLKNARTETSAATLDSGKTATLDFGSGGKSVALNGVSLTNNGTLTIKGDGTLSGSGASTVVNTFSFTQEGSVTISNTSTSTYYALENSNATAVLSGIMTSSYRGVKNTGENADLRIRGLRLTSTDNAIINESTNTSASIPAVLVQGDTTNISSNNIAIYNGAIGRIIIRGGTINGKSVALGNYQNATVAIDSGTLSGNNVIVNTNSSNINIGTGGVNITATNWGIRNTGNGKVSVAGGTITGDKSGINNTNVDAQISITGGTIKGASTAGLELESGSATIENAVISGGGTSSTGTLVGSSGAAGILNKGTGKVTIKSGTIYCANGSNYGIKNTGTGTIEILQGDVSTGNGGIGIKATNGYIILGHKTSEYAGATVSGYTRAIDLSESTGPVQLEIGSSYYNNFDDNSDVSQRRPFIKGTGSTIYGDDSNNIKVIYRNGTIKTSGGNNGQGGGGATFVYAFSGIPETQIVVRSGYSIDKDGGLASSSYNTYLVYGTAKTSSVTSAITTDSLNAVSTPMSVESKSFNSNDLNLEDTKQEKQETNYKIEHYYQDKQTKEYVIDPSLTDTKIANLEDVINITEKEQKIKDGYVYEKSDKNSIIVSENLDENVIKLYYKPDSYEYSVHYFYDGVEDKEKCVTDTGKLRSKISKYEDKVIPGYKLEKVEPKTETGDLELTIKEDEEENIINIYYIKVE